MAISPSPNFIGAYTFAEGHFSLTVCVTVQALRVMVYSMFFEGMLMGRCKAKSKAKPQAFLEGRTPA